MQSFRGRHAGTALSMQLVHTVHATSGTRQETPEAWLAGCPRKMRRRSCSGGCSGSGSCMVALYCTILYMIDSTIFSPSCAQCDTAARRLSIAGRLYCSRYWSERISGARHISGTATCVVEVDFKLSDRPSSQESLSVFCDFSCPSSLRVFRIHDRTGQHRSFESYGI